MCISTYVSEYMCVSLPLCLFVYGSVHVCLCMHVRACLCVSVYVSVHVCWCPERNNTEGERHGIRRSSWAAGGNQKPSGVSLPCLMPQEATGKQNAALILCILEMGPVALMVCSLGPFKLGSRFLLNETQTPEHVFSLSFLLIVQELHSVSFDNSHSPLPPPRSTLSFLPSQLCVLFLISSSIKSSLVCPYSHGCVTFHWCMANLPGATLLKKTDGASPSSCQLSVALWPGVGLHAHLLSPCWISSGFSYLGHNFCEEIMPVQVACCSGGRCVSWD